MCISICCNLYACKSMRNLSMCKYMHTLFICKSILILCMWSTMHHLFVCKSMPNLCMLKVMGNMLIQGGHCHHAIVSYLGKEECGLLFCQCMDGISNNDGVFHR